MAMNAFIGTSGWHYPHWSGRFYPRGLPATRWLEFYSRHLATVEVNNSFYRLLSPVGAGDLRTWREGRPAGVRFAVNASPLLFQLLPRWKVDAERIRNLPGAGDVYAYFDNDQAAYAMQDALELSAMLHPNAGL